jgi:LPS-assembly lipoprotein
VRSSVAVCLLSMAAVSLSACGFAPLYARPGVTTGLAAIQVQAPEGRTGFLIREHLDDAFARNRNAAPAYRMQLALAEQRYPRGVRVDNVATRYEYVLVATYALTALPSGAVAKRGTVRVELTYDSADQPYASVAAQQDAQDRAAEEAARRIQLELATWLAEGGKPPAAKLPAAKPG